MRVKTNYSKTALIKRQRSGLITDLRRINKTTMDTLAVLSPHLRYIIGRIFVKV